MTQHSSFASLHSDGSFDGDLEEDEDEYDWEKPSPTVFKVRLEGSSARRFAPRPYRLPT